MIDSILLSLYCYVVSFIVNTPGTLGFRESAGKAQANKQDPAAHIINARLKARLEIGATGLGAGKARRRLTDEYHANAEHNNIILEEY